MNHAGNPEQEGIPAGTVRRRVHMRNMVQIGQRWRQRRRRSPLTVRIVQVHRADRQVEAEVLGVGLDSRGRVPRTRIAFTELRKKYDLQKDEG